MMTALLTRCFPDFSPVDESPAAEPPDDDVLVGGGGGGGGV